MEPLFYPRHYWRLDGHTPVPILSEEEHIREWTRRRVETDKGADPWRVAHTAVLDSVEVSTVFLCINHQFDPNLPPLLFETMVFGMPEGHYLHEWQERCSTWEQAEKQHESIVEMVTDYVEGELDRKRGL